MGAANPTILAELIVAAAAMALVIIIADRYEQKRPKKPWDKKK